MTTLQLAISIFIFGAALWLGLYLLVRAPREWYARLGGLAHIIFAIGVALTILDRYAPSIELALRYYRYGLAAVILTSLFLLAGLFLLAPNFSAWQRRLSTQKTHLALAWAGMVLYAFCIGLLILLTSDAIRFSALMMAGCALIMIGISFVTIHASDEDESWAPHFFRSFDYALFTALLFGGQVVFLMVYVFDVNYPFLILLMGMIASAVLIQVFSDPVQTVMDKIAFAAFPKIRRTRHNLRAESEAVQLVDPTLDVMNLAEDKFAKHTRKALSHMGDLPKLAANPLNYLPIIDERLGKNGNVDSTLLRAAELKIALIESIARLKPPGETRFGTSDAWRHYNSLYFPYVKGIRPYSRRYYAESNGDTDETTKEALEWFRAQVPERTLYNWQNAAAKLVARDLRERSQS